MPHNDALPSLSDNELSLLQLMAQACSHRELVTSHPIYQNQHAVFTEETAGMFVQAGDTLRGLAADFMPVYAWFLTQPKAEQNATREKLAAYIDHPSPLSRMSDQLLRSKLLGVYADWLKVASYCEVASAGTRSAEAHHAAEYGVVLEALEVVAFHGGYLSFSPTPRPGRFVLEATEHVSNGHLPLGSPLVQTALHLTGAHATIAGNRTYFDIPDRPGLIEGMKKVSADQAAQLGMVASLTRGLN